LGPGNGGLVLNVSESGLALSSAMKLLDNELPTLRFQLPGLDGAIETQARIVWMGQTKKEAGVQFEELPEDDARKISDWISAEQDLTLGRKRPEASEFLAQAADNTLSPKEHQDERLEIDPLWTGTEAQSNHRFPELVVESGFGSTNALPGIRSHHHAAVSVPKRKPSVSLASFAIIALISFGAGLVIENQLRRSPRMADRQTGQVAGQPTITKAPSTESAAANQLPTENAETKTEGIRSETPAQLSPPASGIVKPQEREEHTDISVDKNRAKESGKEGNGHVAYGASKSASSVPNAIYSRRTGSKNAASGTKNSDESGLVLPPSSPPRRTPSSAETRSSAPSKTLVAPTTPAPNSPTVNANATSNPAKPLSGSIAVRVPSFPSMRIPPELKSEASQGGQSLQLGQLISRVQPDYPPEAIHQQIEGTVKVHVIIAPDGSVEGVQSTGPNLLADAATAAIRQWRFRPTLLGGQAIGAEEDVVFVFRLSASTSK
jgi:protein TonB